MQKKRNDGKKYNKFNIYNYNNNINNNDINNKIELEKLIFILERRLSTDNSSFKKHYNLLFPLQ